MHNRNHAILKNSIRLSLDNRALVDELKLLNHDLEGDVAKRTRQLMAAANTDALTGLPNRRRLVEWMDLELDPRGGEAAAVLFLDLDRFKQINDALGHATGDRVLCEAVNRLRERLPRGAILARWGGDEFIIVMKHRTEAAEKARELGEELIAAISRPFEVDEQTVYPGLSVGVALFPDHADGHKALLLAADLAVAEAKRSGRGRVVCYEPSFSKVQMRRYDLSRALSGAIERGELSLHYQPIVTGKDFQLHGFEALARWSQPDLGEIDPAEFIPIAEETDCIHALGYWALRTACAEAALWQDERRGARVAVNVSVKQLAAHDFALRLAQVLTQTGLAPGRLELEVTESVFADDSQSEDRARTIGSLRALGVKLAIDDFGTGYSSLSRLINMPVSSVKIDRTFVSELDGSGVAVVESTIMIARRLGISVVAEGIENAAQAEALAALGVDYFQGYHFGRPAPSIEAVGRLGIEGSRRTPFAGLSVAG